MVQKRAMRAIFSEMGYVDILNHIGVCTLKERRDYLCKRNFTNIQSNTHKVNQLLPEKKDISTMISEHAIRTHYRLLGQTDSVIHLYHGVCTIGNLAYYRILSM